SGGVYELPARLTALAERHWRVVRRAVAMVPFAVVPFLFNQRYFAEYYAGLATAWIAAAVAPMLLSAAAHGRRAWLAAGIFVLLWLPGTALLDVVSPAAPGREVAAWLEEVRTAVGDAPGPEAIAIDAQCSSESATRASRRHLEQLFELSERGEGV